MAPSTTTEDNANAEGILKLGSQQNGSKAQMNEEKKLTRCHLKA